MCVWLNVRRVGCSIEGANDGDYMNIIVTQREDIKPHAYTLT